MQSTSVIGGNRNNRSSNCITQLHSNAQASGILSSLIKILYSRLFDHLVGCVNSAIETSSKADVGRGGSATSSIGILDIYGFEQLERNSLEQLCINCANERLQQFFVEKVLVAEQKMYANEGLVWDEVRVPDASGLLSEMRGVLDLLDDANKQSGKGLQGVTDGGFCQTVHRSGFKSLGKPFLGRKAAGRKGGALKVDAGFVVAHYAGEVEYEVCGWIEKNESRLKEAQESVLRESGNELVKKLSTGKEEEAAPFLPRALGKRGPPASLETTARGYLKGLDALMKTLETCSLHYIRCFKPNEEQKPDCFQGRVVLKQMLHSGACELVKIMHKGFPNRVGFTELSERFLKLLPPKFANLDCRLFVEGLMLAFEVPQADYTLGLTRLFLKSGQMAVLERLRECGEGASKETLERVWGILRRKKLTRCLLAVRFAVRMKNSLSDVRRATLAKKLVFSCRTAGRMMLAVKRARFTLKEQRLDSLSMKINRVWLVAVCGYSWLEIARSKLNARAFVHYWYRMTLCNVVMRRYVRKRAVVIRKKKRVEDLLQGVVRIGLLRIYFRTYLVARREWIDGGGLSSVREFQLSRELNEDLEGSPNRWRSPPPFTDPLMLSQEPELSGIALRRSSCLSGGLNAGPKRVGEESSFLNAFEVGVEAEEQRLWAEEDMRLEKEMDAERERRKAEEDCLRMEREQVEAAMEREVRDGLEEKRLSIERKCGTKERNRGADRDGAARRGRTRERKGKLVSKIIYEE